MTWDRTSKAVYVEWQGWTDSTEFSALHEAGLRALKEHQGARWLADCRNQKAIQQTDPDWVRDWFPRALAAGLRRMAVIITKSGLARMNVEDILRRVPGTELDVGYFTTVEEAREWLTGPLNIPPTGREVKSTP